MRLLLSLCILLLTTSCASKKEELYLFCWGDYINPEVIKDFEEAFDCRVIIDTYDSNEAMYAKLKAGGTGYDLVFPTLYYETIMEKQDMLKPVDKSKLPDLKNIDWNLLNELHINHSRASVPYLVTFTGIGYRNDRVTPAPNSWNIFSDYRYKGRMTLLNDVREVFGVALLTLGYDINTTSKNEIKKALELILRWKKDIAKFESEQYKNGIASAEYLVVQGYSSDLLQVSEEAPQVAFTIPEEGGIISCDTIALIKKPRIKELSYHFINYLCKPDIAIKNMEQTLGLAPNKIAIENLTDEMRSKLFPPKKVLLHSQVIRDIGEDMRLYLEAWDKVKSSN